MPNRPPPSGWYLVAEDGDLTAQLRSGLHVGIDEHGVLRFNPGKGASLRFSWGDQGSLIIEAADAGQMLQRPDGTLEPSYRLGEDQTASVRIGNVAVVLATDVVNAMRRPDQVLLKLVDRQTEPARRSTDVGGATANVREPLSAVSDMRTEIAYHSAIARDDSNGPEPLGMKSALPPEPKLAPIFAQEPRNQRLRNGARQRRRINTGILLALFVFLVLAMPPMDRDPEQPSENRPNGSASTASEPDRGGLSAAARQSPSEAPSASVLFEPVEVLESVDGGAQPSGDTKTDDVEAAAIHREPDSPAGVTAQSDAVPVSRAAPDPRLEQARQLLEQEDVITPPNRNAVALVSEVLYDDPTNEDALRLMQRCADTLVDDAQRALFRGDEFAARNLVEDVLAFHPSHGGANALWQRLTGSPAP